MEIKAHVFMGTFVFTAFSDFLLKVRGV